jgi:hypothetical protein
MECQKDISNPFAILKIIWHKSSLSSIACQEWKSKQIDNLEELPLRILEAQKFIIDVAKKEVAPDIIQINLYGPNYYDLTVTDLPGIVRTVGKNESENLIEEIRNLNMEFLMNERCIILAIHPCIVDFHNSQILADALNVDKETKRTIPVLKKPDLIDKGSELSVLQVLKGKATKEYSKGFAWISTLTASFRIAFPPTSEQNDGLFIENNNAEDCEEFEVSKVFNDKNSKVKNDVKIEKKLVVNKNNKNNNNIKIFNNNDNNNNSNSSNSNKNNNKINYHKKSEEIVNISDNVDNVLVTQENACSCCFSFFCKEKLQEKKKS